METFVGAPGSVAVEPALLYPPGAVAPAWFIVPLVGEVDVAAEPRPLAGPSSYAAGIIALPAAVAPVDPAPAALGKLDE
jgi:hypothetical protein